MATLNEIKRRIASVKSTQQITRAMKMVAAAKLRKSQNRLLLARPYADELHRMLSSMSQSKNVRNHPFFETRKADKVCYVLVTADRGLCGSFNANLIRAVEEELRQHLPAKPRLVAIGRKGYDHYRRRDYPISESYTEFFNHLAFEDAEKITQMIVKQFIAKVVDRVFIVYNEFHSMAQQKIVVRQFLPVERSVSEPAEPRAILYEPNPRQIMDQMLPLSLRYTMYRMLLESFTAEQGARMTAMEQASDNADDMIHDLVLFYNKARQAAITKELNEIVGGAEALLG
jgi:F-type H+-transporting ATPase subunit gamma